MGKREEEAQAAAEKNAVDTMVAAALQDQSVDPEKMDLIMDIPVSVSVEIGRAKMSIRNLLQLNQGGIVALDRLAGDPMDVIVNGTLVAHGEVVIVNDKFGIRLTDIVSKAERIRRLK